MSWIGENLVMKSAANASQQIRRLPAQKGDTNAPKGLQTWLSQSRNVA